jgi:hypothetical protein
MLSCQDLGQRGTLHSPALRSGFNYLYRQSPVASESASDLAFRNSCFPKLCGKNILLLIDTEDAGEVKLLEDKVRTDVEGDNLSILFHAPGVSIKQAYNEQGLKVLADRIEAMVNFVGQNREALELRV